MGGQKKDWNHLDDSATINSWNIEENSSVDETCFYLISSDNHESSGISMRMHEDVMIYEHTYTHKHLDQSRYIFIFDDDDDDDPRIVLFAPLVK